MAAPVAEALLAESVTLIGYLVVERGAGAGIEVVSHLSSFAPIKLSMAKWVLMALSLPCAEMGGALLFVTGQRVYDTDAVYLRTRLLFELDPDPDDRRQHSPPAAHQHGGHQLSVGQHAAGLVVDPRGADDQPAADPHGDTTVGQVERHAPGRHDEDGHVQLPPQPPGFVRVVGHDCRADIGIQSSSGIRDPDLRIGDALETKTLCLTVRPTRF